MAAREPLSDARKRSLLIELIDYLANERALENAPSIDELESKSTDDLFSLFRTLVNTRQPQHADPSFYEAQDELLRGLIAETGTATPDDTVPSPLDERLSLWRGDITRFAADAIVNAANDQMLGCWIPNHRCIDNAIHTFAGVQLREECARQMDELRQEHGNSYSQPTATPMITPAYNLPTKYVIHVVGPIVSRGLTSQHIEELAQCYRSCLALAAENGCASIAFCCISTGVFMFPADKAAEIAVKTARDWLDEHPGSCMKKVVFDVFSENDERIYRKLLHMK